MEISAIVVHVDASTHATARLSHAVALACALPATLVGLLPQRGLTPDAAFFADCESSRVAFETATAGAPIAVDWRVGEGTSLEAMQCEGRLADLIIVSQPCAGEAHRLVDTPPFAEGTILEAGPPVLVIPRTHDAAPTQAWPYPRVMVAWSGTRESARAMRDALPLLRRAQHVALVCCIPVSRHRHTNLAPASYALTWLARRGVRACLIGLRGDAHASPGNALLATARTARTDLLVCGAPASDKAVGKLGGIASTLLEQSTIPALFAR
ncbi:MULTISPECIES: universal stress protein [unclassified Cupriavidus]|uniref:universal stress protein n=1 Tax=unclassified Cupriavidus TaxID=2640874 RepID=UPI0010F72F9F|nr:MULTISPECIES: universal stress protein [unclassified Cupriavidus]MWL91178.1 universal stress protein UspA [Cupriavidus sp. SW-Y-13]